MSVLLPAAGRYISFDPLAEINGDSVRAVLTGVFLPHQCREMMGRHGLPALPRPGQWYPMQAWLNLLAEIEQQFGPRTLYQTGLLMVDHGVFPTGMPTLLAALQALDGVYQTNVRGVRMGYYRASEVAARELRMERCTPHPVEFEHGVVTGLARRYKPAGAVRLSVDLDPSGPAEGLYKNSFRVTW
ncbi:hypothetical protein [Hymenobacter arizonensis]|uniref:Uncharacterized protein n=1 Tax=Hymenobacter arizonensis TaxID=1227077 RepID=A0A1I6BJY7_HYMAR|nr:hypothetical protein [Hymenobacter arizonensis]SFQ81245.1 hypothetical protein SAMN04515668_4636 [Hymenobacter arizonensis]